MPKKISDSIARLKRLVPRLRGKRIGVLGDLMLDRYLWGKTSRISPEAPVPVVDFEGQTERPGGAGNVAANLAVLGARVEAFGVIGGEKNGADEAGCALLRQLREVGIAQEGVIADSKRITTVKTRIIAAHQQVVRVDYERRDPLRPVTQEKILSSLFSSMKRLDALVLSDYDKGVVGDDLAARAVGAAHHLKLPVFVGLKSKPHAYRGVFLVTCNSDEASRLVNRPLSDEKSLEEGGRAILNYFSCSAVLVTRGKEGMNLFEESATHSLHIPATGLDVTYAHVGQAGTEREATGRQVFDRTGAGDTVLSVLALAVAAGASLTDAAMLANTAAGVVVGKLGTASVSPQELQHALDELRG